MFWDCELFCVNLRFRYLGDEAFQYTDNNTHNDTKQQSPPETIDLEILDKGTGNQDNNGINDQKKQT